MCDSSCACCTVDYSVVHVRQPGRSIVSAWCGLPVVATPMASKYSGDPAVSKNSFAVVMELQFSLECSGEAVIDSGHSATQAVSHVALVHAIYARAFCSTYHAPATLPVFIEGHQFTMAII